MTHREVKLMRAVLAALAAVPADLLLVDEVLRADAARMLAPRATVAEMDWAIHAAEKQRRIAGIVGELGPQWQITAAGRLWLAQNP